MGFDFFSIVQFYAKLVFLNLKNEAGLREAVLTSQGSLFCCVYIVVNMATCILSFPALFPMPTASPPHPHQLIWTLPFQSSLSSLCSSILMSLQGPFS